MWTKQIQDKLNEIVNELGLPKDSLRIEKNLAKDGKKITSYSVCIFEPDYPVVANASSRNGNVLNIKTKKDSIEFLVSKNQLKKITIPESALVKELKSDKLYTHIIFGLDDPKMMEFVERNVRYCVDNYSSKAEAFGCCAKFRDCSKLGKCIHENLLYAKGCQYRKNLEKGNAFLIDA